MQTQNVLKYAKNAKECNSIEKLQVFKKKTRQGWPR